MGATSSQGVGNGAGYANKGPQNGRNQYVPLVSPHIVLAGKVTLAGGTATVVFPEALTGAGTDYAVIVTPRSGSTAPAVTTRNDNSDGNFISFVVTGGNVAHDYIVVKHGLGF